MSDTTPVNGWFLAESTDELDITEAVGRLAAEVDDDLLPVMTTATRDVTISPSKGMLSYVLDRKAIEIFDGTVWREADRTRIPGSGDLKLTDTSIRNVPGVSYRVNANGTYYIDGVLAVTGNSSDDLTLRWSLPSSTTGRWIIASNGNISTDINSSITVNFTTNGGFPIHVIGYCRITETGSITLRANKGGTSNTTTIHRNSIAFNFTRIV